MMQLQLRNFPLAGEKREYQPEVRRNLYRSGYDQVMIRVVVNSSQSDKMAACFRPVILAGAGTEWYHAST